ncbi:MAG: archease, partial [Candidatus ainarchaeum sp.]|nr:archease [Candidatus ainarchaeum sp.]
LPILPMKRFVFLEHTADAKFRAFGKSIEECFENSALAMNSIERNLKKVSAKQKLSIEAEAKNPGELLHKFLEEILFQMETKGMLFSKFRAKINLEKNSLRADCFGEPINKKKHELKILIKAATWNSFELKNENGKWIAQVVCDT